MHKKFILLFILITGGIILGIENQDFTYVSNINGIDLKKSPVIDGNSIHTLPYRTKVKILKTIHKNSKRWYQVGTTDQKQTGWAPVEDFAKPYQPQGPYQNMFYDRDILPPINYKDMGGFMILNNQYNIHNKDNRLGVSLFVHNSRQSYMLWLTETLEYIESYPISLILDTITFSVDKSWYYYHTLGETQCRLKSEPNKKNIIAFVSEPVNKGNEFPVIEKVYRAVMFDTVNRKLIGLDPTTVECYFLSDPDGI